MSATGDPLIEIDIAIHALTEAIDDSFNQSHTIADINTPGLGQKVNVVDGLFAIAAALSAIARNLHALGPEAGCGADVIAESLSGIGRAIGKSKERP